MSCLNDVKNVILVLSGKGGVGKSTVTAQLALSLAEEGKNVGILDVDICGPSIPMVFNLNGVDVHQSEKGWLPVETKTEPFIKIMSIGFLLKDRNNAVIWRGPKKNSLITQFINDVNWGDLDYLIIDTPPGTSDEHISVVKCLKDLKLNAKIGAVLVTTPQILSVNDVRREITFCKKAEVPLHGIIENMSGYVCPHCSECTNIFSRGGGESLAKHANVAFLGSIPIDPKLGEAAELGLNYVNLYKDSEASIRFKSIARNLMEEVI